MSSRSWIRKLFARKPRTVRKAPPRPRPAIEALEERSLLSVSPLTAPFKPMLAMGSSSQAAPANVARVSALATPLVSVTSLSEQHVRLRFNVELGRGAGNPSNYTIPGLTVESATLQPNRTDVLLKTSPQEQGTIYTVDVSNVHARNGTPLPAPISASFQGTPAATLLSVRPRTSNSLVLKFNTLLNAQSARNPSSYSIDGLSIKSARLLWSGTAVVLTTSPQEDVPYSIEFVNLRTRVGNRLVDTGDAHTFHGYPGDQTPPRVTGAASTGNTTILVSFSEEMSDAALNPAFYKINQTTFNPEAGVLRVLGTREGEEQWAPEFLNGDRTLVVLTTSSQNELSYTLTAFNLTDLAGNVFAPPTISGSQRVDPAQATFTGTPPSGAELVDTDGDGLTDNDEMRGWQVTVTPANGIPQTRGVTSDPFSEDTDGDGFTDNVEAQLRLDPRDADSDDDLLTDWQEYTEVFSDHLRGDSDGDGVDDGTEFLGVFSSPVFADTDGDQINDGLEIPLGGARNILKSDLPRPEISVGSVNLQLDVRFTETNNRESRDLGTDSFRATLANASTETITRQHTANVEASLGFGNEEGGGGRGANFVSFDINAGYTYNYTHETADESRREYEKSFQTEREVTQGFTTERNVVGATMQVAVNLSNLSDLAYRVKNLQVTALIQDPLDHSRLTPVATLVPDAEPEEGFTLGPLVANRGPILFSNTTIIPSLVEELMANSTGLIFRISNYDIVDEKGRNFAFASQEVVERTGAVLIDYGGASKLLAEVNGEDFDETNPPRQAEIHRVATSSGRVIDTDDDGDIDTDDRRVTFNLAGKEVGITLHSALGFIGLTRYDESEKPTSSLSQEEVRNSYSTIQVEGVERIFRVRDIANDAINDRYWEIIGAQGILRDVDLDTLILNAGKTISLNYVQDLDQDGLPADVEYFLRTSDSPDPAGTAVPSSTDTTNETVRFGTDPKFATGSLVHVSRSGGGLTAGRHYYVRSLGGGSYSFYASAADARAGTAQGRVDLTGSITAVVGAPRGRDTDQDGLDDRFEALIGWKVTTPQRTYQVYSSPNRADSNFDHPPAGDSDGDGSLDRQEYDGSDLAAAPAGWNDTDGNGLRDKGEVFQLATGDHVLDPIRQDTDGDGISDATEIIGFKITRITDGSTFVRNTKPNTPFTDSDTFSDGFEKLVGLDPTDGNDTDQDADGLPDPVETLGWTVRTFGVSTSAYQQPTATVATKFSRTDSVDSDGDGLTDYDEYFLRTDPSAKDSDNDGLDDRVERLGYDLGHQVGSGNLGIIQTNPLDADTDNDKRSDGVEAELADANFDGVPDSVDERTRWVVRVKDAVPYRAFSNPLVADADFDGIVDGDEFPKGTDPNNGNTDADKLDDGEEISTGTNPLAEDFRVTVYFTQLAVAVDGDAADVGGNGIADYAFDLAVRLPGTGTAGLATAVTSVVQEQVDINQQPIGGFTYGGASEIESILSSGTGSLQRDSNVLGLRINDNATLNFVRTVPVGQRSITFGMTADQSFSVEALVAEIDGAGSTETEPTASTSPASLNVSYVSLGGIDGLQAERETSSSSTTQTIRPIFRGTDLLAETSAFIDLSFTWGAGDNIQVGPAHNGNTMSGSLYFTIFIG